MPYRVVVFSIDVRGSCKYIVFALNVKLVLFRSFCLCMYDVTLWTYYSVTVFSKFRAAYNKCINRLFGCASCESEFISGIFLELGLPTADTIVCIVLVLSLLVVMQSDRSVSFANIAVS